MRTSNITKLRTCGCGLRILKRRCGLAVADYAFKRAIADLRLRIKKIEIRSRICGLLKKLAVPSTDNFFRWLVA